MKTKEEIFEQLYISAKDLKVLIPTMGINQCRNLIQEIADEERNNGLYVPVCRTAIAPTKSVRKKLRV